MLPAAFHTSGSVAVDRQPLHVKFTHSAADALLPSTSAVISSKRSSCAVHASCDSVHVVGVAAFGSQVPLNVPPATSRKRANANTMSPKLSTMFPIAQRAWFSFVSVLPHDGGPEPVDWAIDPDVSRIITTNGEHVRVGLREARGRQHDQLG